jgi:hypothetical protein
VPTPTFIVGEMSGTSGRRKGLPMTIALIQTSQRIQMKMGVVIMQERDLTTRT